MFNKSLKISNYIPDEKNTLQNNEILDIENLKVYFKTKSGFVQAVRGVDLKVNRGEIIGLVGESGSGKSVSVKSIMGFNEGSILKAKMLNLNSIDILGIKKKDWPFIRGTRVGYIPQDPLSSLDPTKKIKTQIIDAIKITQKRKYNNAIFEINAYASGKLTQKQVSNQKYISNSLEEKKQKLKEAKEAYKLAISKESLYEKMYNVLTFIGIKNIEKSINSYPHEFSGGMRQRIVIAMTIVGEPDLIIADEPTTALDVTIQAKVIDLIKKLRDNYKIAIIFISHNISLVANLCDYIYIMYAGRIVEKGTVSDIFTNPKHPYTWALIGSIPDPKSSKELTWIIGTPPNMISPPKGDAFAARNIYARKIDFEKQPPMFKISETHYAATWLLHKDAPYQPIPEEIKEKLLIAKKSIAIKNRNRGNNGK